jgi:hypothetical protein
MKLDLFILRLAILLIPGIAGYKTYRALKSSGIRQKHLKDWEDFFIILLYSISSYLLLMIIESLIGYQVTILDTLVNENINKIFSINYLDILFSTITSIFIGVISAFFYNNKIIFKFFRLIKVTNHFGDDDVWSYINN